MPIYEYYCRRCNEKFTQLRPIAAAAEPSAECRDGHRAMKVITTAAVLSGAAPGPGRWRCRRRPGAAAPAVVGRAAAGR